MTRPSFQLLNYIYPVGAIYISVNPTTPDVLFGGKWEQINGRFLFAEINDDGVEANTSNAFGTLNKGQFAGWCRAGEMGGEFYHTLSIDEIPSHSHISKNYSHNYDNGVTIPSGHSYAKTYGGTIEGTWSFTQENLPNGEINEMAETSETGNSVRHSNMPPYLSVYMWKRIG